MNRIESKVYSVQIRKNLFKNVTPIKIRMIGGRHHLVEGAGTSAAESRRSVKFKSRSAEFDGSTRRTMAGNS